MLSNKYCSLCGPITINANWKNTVEKKNIFLSSLIFSLIFVHEMPEWLLEHRAGNSQLVSKVDRMAYTNRRPEVLQYMCGLHWAVLWIRILPILFKHIWKLFKKSLISIKRRTY